MKMFKMIAGMLATALLLAGCGGGTTLTNPTGGGGGGGGGTATAAKLTLASAKAAILADGSTTASLTALALDANNVVVANIPVTFAATSGGLAVGSTKTDVAGTIGATLSTGNDPTIRTITVTASAGSLTATVAVQVIANGSSSPVAAVTVMSDSPTIVSDGSQVANITAYVRDVSNNLIPNVPVVFSASSGGIASSAPTTDATGTAKAVLSTAADPTLRTITVKATVGTHSATVPVQVVAGTGAVTLQMGSGTGAAFTPSTIAIQNPALSAGGSTSLQVVLQQSDGTLYNQSATINFSSACAAQSQATLTPSVTTTTGIATATYSASGCSNSDTITATTTIGGHQLSATGTVTVALAAIGSISFVSVGNPIIALKGIGSTSLPERTTVTFRVYDQGGSPRANATVKFSLNTSVGGVALLNNTAQSNVDGTVQTIVQSGTVATPVRVTATVQGVVPTIATQSSQLTISTGIPAQDSFSLSVKCPNVETWRKDDVQVPVTALLADRFHNPVPDGTAVLFYTEGGQIQAQCSTQITNGAAACTVNWTSANPRAPRDATLPACLSGSPVAGTCDRSGRSSLIAIAIGEESFVDANGNGQFDVGESYTDKAERFLDANENGIYDPGEFFYDFNGDFVRDAPDGIFNGVLCNDPARCNAAAQSTGIDAHNMIIMSDGAPSNLAPAPGTALADLSLAAGTGIYSFYVADVNFNPLPAGTTVAASVTGTGLALAAGSPTTYTIPCMTEPGSYAFVVQATAGTAMAGESGTLFLTITAPSGLISIGFYSFKVVP